MKVITLRRKQINLKEYRLRSALEEDYTTLYRESVAIRDADDGEIKIIYQGLELDSVEIFEALKRIEYQISTRSGGLKTTSRILGYAPRMERRNDFCHIASLALEFPKEHKIITDYAKQVAKIYSREQPDMYKKHKKLAEKVLNDYMIEDTPFTSGIINKNNPLKYHFDQGNFKEVYSCMLGFKYNIGGGYLSCPEYNCAFEIHNNSIFIFDGQKILHGVTPFKLLTEDALRFTIVFYSLKKMWECLPIDDEIIRARLERTKKEERRATVDPSYYINKYKKKEARKFKDVR